MVAGHTVSSRIKASLPEQLLSEAVQQLVSSQRQAEQWWVQTLAYHQGHRSLRPLSRGIQFLVSAGMLTASPARSGDVGLSPTELGRLTARLMVSPVICDGLRHALARLLAARGHVGPRGRPVSAAGPGGASQRGDLARAALLAVANSPEAFRPGVRQIGGIPYGAVYPILEEVPRYLHWLASQGLFGTVHPWCAIVAADLERRPSSPPRPQVRQEPRYSPGAATTALPAGWPHTPRYRADLKSAPHQCAAVRLAAGQRLAGSYRRPAAW
jgi:helicase